MRIAVLGVTGLVGQKFVALLHHWHPDWVIAEVVASDSKYGQPYLAACVWQEPISPMPEAVRALHISKIEEVKSDVIVSCLPASAESMEAYFLSQGKIVFSNASAYRMHPWVPIIIPEINTRHFRLLEEQPYPGKMITSPNCCVSGIALALAPLRKFSLDHIHVVTLQSASGAGYPGVPSLDLLANTVPHIVGEEEKILRETQKILGDGKQPLSCKLSVTVHRVPVAYGHTLSLHVTFSQNVDPEEISHCYQEKNEEFPNTYQLYDNPWYPQARKHLSHDDMRVHIGPITYGGDLRTIKMNVLIHNLVRGAAGNLLANIQSYFSNYLKREMCLR
ncbi:Aspartate-semialdehyde dehydrogenase,aspartate-semialdehyde dehydrogenase,Aspartate-semialdehyde dehydrogenase,aspartate-semialdehyde dehydrogenase,Semialdehyde dehydrogenase, dimerisation domain [Chlamydia serpentis]|uniref:Aspartate-semialdehyde dehydrogenase,aspartate-semialdehyde dehydrogenase,Aspartate-semialdehyde dehydrogenase,aspartate-semialdehyde dehydrogenase,Semialdehyde dehydrogenase, dimerisation domain n=1 Tax=Chlamydia serpentis TaxID=1967782 RepID=A0A2R8FCL1_9CHLA|nr:aspartate-semialdehyde dehydrogenase [Chlamydia serpentis]SPN74153.1 Aspartate-semialdehyde dehydrogenase,aspartate-semialdehyde dehydrogenase,Aspartate-semialdehyde dehydrogenase,aspartate-semialdehyde dehydrogenase,Semialdehyde dehydrogenase, dimerisation domain [Chlamydia serpentis]